MVIQKKYINKVEHVWYESSNVIYTACYDNDTPNKTIKAVFKEGRTYLYRDVDMNDYIMFARGTESTGEAFNKYIVKKYKGARVSDTPLDKLEEFRKECFDIDRKIEESLQPFSYALQINDSTGDFRLTLNGETVFEGVEGQVSVLRLLNAMHIPYVIQEGIEGEILTEEKFMDEPLV